MSIGAITPTYERQKYVDFLTPYRIIETKFATYLEPPQSDIFLLIRIMKLPVLFIITVSWMLASFVIFLAHKLQPNHMVEDEKWSLFSDVATELLGTAFRQSEIFSFSVFPSLRHTRKN